MFLRTVARGRGCHVAARAARPADGLGAVVGAGSPLTSIKARSAGNDSRKRNAWGVKHQRPRPASDWLRLEASELAIVPAALWARGSPGVAVQRERYSRTKLRSAPPWGVEARYLLTGLLRCAICRGGMEGRSRRSTGRTHRLLWGRSAYHRRGTAVCNNALTVPMENADTAVLQSLKSNLLNPRGPSRRPWRVPSTGSASRVLDTGPHERTCGPVDQEIAA